MTAPLASIIIPIAPQHAALSARAIASAHAQTVACEVIPIVDDEQRGAAWARNRGIEQANAEFVTFLDADDWLLPNFVERCWSLCMQSGRYVYTDFLEDNGLRHDTPECPWVNDAWHAVTAFIPTEWVRAIDGFDEDLREGGEDSEFFLHLCSEGHCGTRLPEALFVYTNAPDGRSKRWRGSDAFHAYNAMLEDRYISKGLSAMGCCTEPAKKLKDPTEPAPQMVLARPRWGGNRRERGLVTGTLYPPADRSQVLEIDPRDAAARPTLWEVLVRPTPPPPMPAAQTVQLTPPNPPLVQLGQRVLNVKPPPYQPPPPPPPAEIAPSQPNVAKVTRLAQKMAQPAYTPPRSNDGGWHTDPYTGVEYIAPPQMASIPTMDDFTVIYDFTAAVAPTLQRTGDPVFVFPDKDYLSYTDVRRLVELSGFEIVTLSNAESRFADTYVYLSPEQPPANLWGSRHIWWSLEYGGEYEPDLSNWHGEVWSCDPAWAKAHGAKLVVMGSHPGLKGYFANSISEDYHYLMLAYQTERRQRIAQQLADLRTPQNPYPGYGQERHNQLVASRLMLHVHQRDDTRAIAPQRIALAAAYKLPLICESVAEPGVYQQYIPFIDYANLNGEVRSQLAMMETGMPQARGERLYSWLCEEHTFRKSVEEALKS